MSIKESFKAIIYILKYTIKMQPVQFFINIPISICHSASLVLITVANMVLADGITGALSSSKASFSIVSMILGVLFANVIHLVFNGIHNFFYGIRTMRLKKDFEKCIFDKIERINAIHYEDTRFLDKLEKAKKGIDTGLFASDLIITLFTFYIPYFIFMALFLSNINGLLSVIVILVFSPVLLGQISRTHIYNNLEDNLSHKRRLMKQKELEIYGLDYFKDTRHYKAKDLLINYYREIIKKYNHGVIKSEKKSVAIILLSKGLTAIGFFVIVIIIFYLFTKREITAGAVATIIYSLNTMFSTAEEVINIHIGSIMENSVGGISILEFLNYEEEIESEVEEDWEKGIVLNNVYFRYPNSSTDTLKNINISISKNDTVAIVGANGSGKTTLLKILCGLYYPNLGEAMIAGISTKQYGAKVVWNNATAVFQNYKRYKMNVVDNIIISSNGKKNESKLENILSLVEIDDKIKKDEILSKDFGGVDISGGQWQRLALGRGLYKEAVLLVCDEPISAIDPIEADKIYNIFKKVSRDKLVFIVSHNLASVKFASKIIVLDQGEIVEVGNHQDLLNKQGLYYNMYMMQSKWYNS